MPELPDLEVIREVLSSHLPGAVIESVDVRRPIIVRNLLGGDLGGLLAGRRFADVSRRGKFLLLRVDDGPVLVINPMLAGRLRYGAPLPRARSRDALVLTLSDGNELRYHDAAGMGKIYVTADPELVPAFAGQGPEADDAELSLADFRERMKRHSGEIKGMLTNQQFVAGVGNAYADEICWRAGLYPFRRRPTLQPEEQAALYEAMRVVLQGAIATLRVRVGETIDVEVRDFLAIHGRSGQPCPRCGAAISEVTRERRKTNFCRTCQPGLMVDR